MVLSSLRVTFAVPTPCALVPLYIFPEAPFRKGHGNGVYFPSDVALTFWARLFGVPSCSNATRDITFWGTNPVSGFLARGSHPRTRK